MPAEARGGPSPLSDADREALAEALCRGLYQLWLRRASGASAPAPRPRHRQAPAVDQERPK